MLNKPMNYLSKSESDTESLAEKIGKNLKIGDVICLQGDLGMGKSVFARALIRSLAEDNSLEVPSPTFTLLQTYETASGPVWHFDLYRIEEPEEIYELGWEDGLKEAINIIEWPERLGDLKPNRTISIGITPVKENANHRNIELHSRENWVQELGSL